MKRNKNKDAKTVRLPMIAASLALCLFIAGACSGRPAVKKIVPVSGSARIIFPSPVSNVTMPDVTAEADDPPDQPVFRADPENRPSDARPLTDVEKKWGIQIVSLRLSSAGYMLDFRFKVLDPVKAAPLLVRTVKPYLEDEASGLRVIVPVTGKVGALRQDTLKPDPGHIYFIFFANPGAYIKSGNKATVVIGKFEAKHLIVQ